MPRNSVSPSGGPWSPFESNWHLRQEYKNSRRREELASVLSRRLLLLGVANLLFAPVIFMWQILYSFFRYAEVRVSRRPSESITVGNEYASNFFFMEPNVFLCDRC